MRAMTRVLGLSIVVSLWMAAGASATGPGGWDHLGTGASSNGGALNGRVDALLSVPHFGAIPDSVYAGGVFTSAGGNTSAVAVARWDGNAWHSIGAPPISTAAGAGVAAIAVDAATGKIYVGGNFTNAGGNGAADFLAVWDGASWQPFCAPITANVKALQIIGRTLYVGGDFADAAGLASADKLVRCDLDTGTPSSTVLDAAHEINSAVYALTADSAGRRMRRPLAHALRGIVEASERPPLSPARWPRAEVARAGPELLALAERLECPEAVDARGVALVRVILADGGGPLHVHHGPHDLVDAAREAATALEPDGHESSRRRGA